jgi:hypothetical protein
LTGEREAREERTEDLIQVRRVTQLHAAWTEGERGSPGAFTVQLILDNGAAGLRLAPDGRRRGRVAGALGAQ